MTTYKKVSAKTGKVSWFCTFYYKDNTGKRHQKKKEGFATQREAKEYERSFIAQHEAAPGTAFKDFIQVYLADRKHTLRASTFYNAEVIIRKYFLPTFGDMPINAITPAHVRQWQNSMTDIKPSTLKTIKQRLSAIFNYAVNIYGLKVNPVRLAGKADTARPQENKRELHLWTAPQFYTFMDSVTDMLCDTKLFRPLFLLLYYSGMRIGEALALTPEDIDIQANTVSISKSTGPRIKGAPRTYAPKTPAGNRVVTIPAGVTAALADLMSAQRGRVRKSDRLFPITNSIAGETMKKIIKAAGLPFIRLHDLRHSHASLLIEKGFSPIAIKDRLGHERIEITLNTYSHLYPNKQGEIAKQLQTVFETGLPYRH